MNRGAWQATVHGVAKSWIQLSDLARMHARMTHQEIPTHRLAYCLATKKKEQTTDTCNEVDAYQKHYIEQNRPD